MTQDVVIKKLMNGETVRDLAKSKGLETVDGEPVNYIAQGVYEIMSDTGPIRVRSDDLKAP